MYFNEDCLTIVGLVIIVSVNGNALESDWWFISNLFREGEWIASGSFVSFVQGFFGIEAGVCVKGSF